MKRDGCQALPTSGQIEPPRLWGARAAVWPDDHPLFTSPSTLFRSFLVKIFLGDSGILVLVNTLSGSSPEG